MANRKQGVQKPRMGKPKLRLIPAPSKNAPDFGPAEQAYFRALHKIIDQIFEEAANSFQWTWSQLAAHARLGYVTVANLGERVTIYPRYSTIHKLAEAVGWKLSIEQPQKKPHVSTAKIAAG